MLINSFFGRNKCTSRTRRSGRRDIRRRFLMIGLPVLLVGILAGNIIWNTFAEDGAIVATLNIDISKYDYERHKKAEPDIGNITSAIAQIEIFVDYAACDADGAGGSPTSAIANIYNSSSDLVTRTLNLTPGKHCIDYIVNSAEGVRYSGYPSRWWVWGYYFDSYYKRPESKSLVDYYGGQYIARYDEIEVTDDGRILDSQGNPYKIVIEPYNDPENTVKVPYELKSYKNNEIPKNEKLVVNLYRSNSNNLLAQESVDITDTGTGEVVFKRIEREFPISYYYIDWYVTDENGNTDQNWTNASRQGSYYIVNDELLPIRYNCSYSMCYDGNDPLALTSTYRKSGNDNYLDKVSKSETNGTNEFHLAKSANDIVHNGHYMIVAKNNVDGAYYALSANNNSYATKLTDLNGSNLDSYKISDDTLKNSDYVYTVRWPEYDGSVAKAKFTSNVISSNGRPVTLKLGTSRYSFDEMFNDIGGATLIIEKSPESSKFSIRKKIGSTLLLNDYFGNVTFGKTWGITGGFEFYLDRNQSSSSNILRRSYMWNTEGVSSDLFAECDSFIAVTTTGYNNGSCILGLNNPSYYNSESYYNAWQQNADDMSVYILTDVETQDSEPKEQLIEHTYYPVEDMDISAEDSYKNRYNSNFLLVHKDSFNRTHILNANESVKGSGGRTYYTGTTAKINTNTSITTLQKNAFSFDSNEDIKSESTGQLKLHGLKQNDPKNSNPYIMLDADDNGNFVSYAKSRKEMSFYFNDDNTLYLRGSKSDRWIGWGEFEDENGETKQGFVSVDSKDKAIKFDIYWLKENGSYIDFYSLNKESYNRRYDYYYYDVDGYNNSTNSLSNRIKSPIELGATNNNGDIFVGWTLDIDKAGVYDLGDEFENIYDADDGLDEEFISKYNIASSTDYFDPESIATRKQYIDMYGTHYYYSAKLYPVYIKHATTKAALVNDPNTKALIGATDWKDSQRLTPTTATASNNTLKKAAVGESEEKDTQVWQGSINVETYVDGKLYGEPSKLYFQYHNDDAADVILKFVDDSKLAAQTGGDADTKLQQYLLDESILPAKSQNGDYVIDAVIAEQAGSEDGLKYAYNWVNESGARLDNVKGGSTIKVYMSNKYQVKYYLDDNELTDGTYQDTNYYASDATMKAIEAEEAMWNLNASITDEQLKGLMDKNVTEVGNSEVYKPADSKRFTFEGYKYIVHERDNKFTAAKAPTIPAGMKFKSVKWQIKDANENIIAEISPEKLAAISEQEGGLEEYFNALTQYAYKTDSDNVNTFHLYLYTEPETADDTDTPEEKPKDIKNPEQAKNPLTSPGAIAFYFMLTGASIAGLGLMAYKRNH